MDALPLPTMQEDNTPDVVLPVIVLLVFLAFFVWMLYLLISSNWQESTPANPVTTDIRNPEFLLCPAGNCAINLVNGAKTCATDPSVQLPYNPAISTCSGRFVCDNPLMPFALQSDGSTNINGVCESGVECACLTVSQCPDYVLSAFTTSNGNPYTAFTNQRITFPQVSSFIGTNGVAITTPPLQITNPSTTFCAAPLSWLPFSNPGCNFISANDVNEISYDDIVLCMGLASGCNGATGNACLTGVLAVITDNPDTLTPDNLQLAQFGCVAGTNCPCGYINVYDTGYGGIVCRQLT